MAPRPSWKGYLKLSLVSCAVALYPATTTSQRIRFHIINRKTGHRIRNLVVDAETGEPVDEQDRVKGYEIEKGRYVLIEDEEFDQVALETTHTIDIDSFVPRNDVDEIYLDESFYLAPTDAVAAEAFAVIREAMRKENLVGLARLVIYRRERILMLQPRGKGLLATALRYRNEVRDEKPYFADIPDVKVPADMLDLARHVLEHKRGTFDPSRFEDRYESALLALIKAKDAGKPPPKMVESRPSNVVNLMDALRRSLRGDTGRPRAAPGGRKGAPRPSPAVARPRVMRSRVRAKRAG